MEVEKQVGSGPETKMVSNIPYTPRVKRCSRWPGRKQRRSTIPTSAPSTFCLDCCAKAKESRLAFTRVSRSISSGRGIDSAGGARSQLHSAGIGAGRRRADIRQEGRQDASVAGVRRDLTDLAKKNELDPVIGRHNEIERVIQVLCRRTKNNPVLLGEANVGKTAIARRAGPGDCERERARAVA